MSTKKLRDRSGKMVRQSRPINLEQLETRMMCTVSGLEQSLQLLNLPLVPWHVGAAATTPKPNEAPTITIPINSGGSSNITTDAKSVALSAVASDDGKANLLKYNWQVIQAPEGSETKFSKNGTNAAQNTVLTFNRAGTYSIQLTVADAGGLTVTTTQTVSVTSKATRLEMLSPGNTVQGGGKSISTKGTSVTVQAIVYDQFNQRMSDNTSLTWTLLSTTTEGTATKAVEGNTAAFTFNRAGMYSFNVTAAAASLRFNISVGQALSQIVLTPGTATVAAGKTQLFTAVGLDQFQLPMTAKQTFTWTTSGGTISSKGIFTAPQTSGTFTITAAAGSSQAQAVVTVNGVTSSELHNAVLSNLVQTYFADGSITRPEMIQLLRAAGTDGTVDSVELADLRYIVSNASKYNIANYVQVLAGNVVNTNLANGLYQGTAAGNLVAGSTGAQLNNLVDKWFLGTDRPTLTNGSLSYSAASGSLFVGAPTYANEKQGALGDCYFIAALGSMGSTNPDAVRNMFVNNGDGTYTVRFFGGNYGAFYNSDGTISDGFANGSGVADYVTVDSMLPATSSGRFAYSNYGASLSNPGNVLWIAMAEKAYAQWNATGKSGRTPANSYASIEGGWMSNVNAQVLGYNSTRYASSTAANKQALVNALAAGNAVTVGSLGNSTALVSSHAYSITAYDAQTDKFTLFNPWGSSQPGALTWAQIQANTSAFVVVNALQSTAIASSFKGGVASVRGEVRQSGNEFAAPLLSSGPQSSWVHIQSPAVAIVQDFPTESEAAPVETQFDSAAPTVTVAHQTGRSEQIDAAPTRAAVDMLLNIECIDDLLEEAFI